MCGSSLVKSSPWLRWYRVVHSGFDRLFPWKFRSPETCSASTLVVLFGLSWLVAMDCLRCIPTRLHGNMLTLPLDKELLGLLVRMRPAFESSTRRSCCGPCTCPTSISQSSQSVSSRFGCSRAHGLVTSLGYLDQLVGRYCSLNPVSHFCEIHALLQ
jgi:hypothetical protein